jgi:hypothetical protein
VAPIGLPIPEVRSGIANTDALPKKSSAAAKLVRLALALPLLYAGNWTLAMAS